MSTEAKRAGNARHLEKLDRIELRPYKAEGEEIRAAAAEIGESVQGFVLKATRERMEDRKANYERLTIRIKADGSDGISVEAIRAAAERDGVSMNAWVIDAINDKI